MKKLQIKKSQIPKSGKGLFALESIKSGEIICGFLGEFINKKELELRGGEYSIEISSKLFFDTLHYESFAKYANDVNGTKKSKFHNNSYIEIHDNMPVLVSTKDIKPGEEIFCDYGEEYWK